MERARRRRRCRAVASSTSTPSSPCRTPRSTSTRPQTHLTGFWGVALEPTTPRQRQTHDARWAELAAHGSHGRHPDAVPGAEHAATRSPMPGPPRHGVVVRPRLRVTSPLDTRGARRRRPARPTARTSRPRPTAPSSPGCRGGQLVTPPRISPCCGRTVTSCAPATPSPRLALASPRPCGWAAPSTRRSPEATSVVTPSRPAAAPTSGSSAPTAYASSSRTTTAAGGCSRRRARGSSVSTTARGGMPPRRVPRSR